MTDLLMTGEESKKVQRDLITKIFPAVTISLALFFIVFLIAAFTKHFGILFIYLSLISLVIGILFFILVSRKLRQDLRIRKVKLLTALVIDKKHKVDYEAGSATVPVSIWTLLTPKVFGKEMKQLDIYKIGINEGELDLKKADYDNVEVGEEILIRKAYYSDLFLGLEKIKA